MRAVDFDLHEDCMFPKLTIHHALFKNSTFKFFSQSPGGHRERYCDACGKHVRGFMYHCEEQGWDLHPSCVNLPRISFSWVLLHGNDAGGMERWIFVKQQHGAFHSRLLEKK
ncbi:hypothetical protein Q3G72_025529 [Acer saccharum]|nr:hypothetical protein Q3G72_025529 [Acer saccharum]